MSLSCNRKWEVISPNLGLFLSCHQNIYPDWKISSFLKTVIFWISITFLHNDNQDNSKGESAKCEYKLQTQTRLTFFLYGLRLWNCLISIFYCNIHLCMRLCEYLPFILILFKEYCIAILLYMSDWQKGNNKALCMHFLFYK